MAVAEQQVLELEGSVSWKEARLAQREEELQLQQGMMQRAEWAATMLQADARVQAESR